MSPTQGEDRAAGSARSVSKESGRDVTRARTAASFVCAEAAPSCRLPRPIAGADRLPATQQFAARGAWARRIGLKLASRRTFHARQRRRAAQCQQCDMESIVARGYNGCRPPFGAQFDQMLAALLEGEQQQESYEPNVLIKIAKLKQLFDDCADRVTAFRKRTRGRDSCVSSSRFQVGRDCEPRCCAANG